MSERQMRPDEQRDAVIKAALPNVPFDGWNPATLRQAAETAGLDADAAVRLFPGGAVDAVAHFMAMADRLMVEDLAAMDLSALSTRGKVAAAVRVRLTRWQGNREAIRRALALSPMPPMAGRMLSGWYRTVDAIWCAIGDRPVDFSYYTKRALLGAVYAATLLYWLDDRSDEHAATWAFLDRRLADVMRIPKVRGKLEEALRFAPNPFRLARRVTDRIQRQMDPRAPRRS